MNESSPFESFHPDENYTTRIKNILTEYPDGSQILREILQNSDDAKSTIQTFILDHNTYPTEKLCDSRLDRYQGPALLAANDTIFQPEDFKSLLNLANSEKRNKFDKIGVMGIGFNSVFHITDVSSIISGSSYVLIDPHARGYCDLPPGQRGFQGDFVEHDLVKKYPDQFMPFSVALNNNLNGFYNGTIFRYSLRTKKDASESEISDKIYQINQIKEMFDTFFNVDNISCLMFLKYIERISFYEIKKGETIPTLLYQIEVTNAKEISDKRKLLANNIMSIIKSPKNSRAFETIYKMEFCQSSSQCSIKNDVSKNKGKLYCFLPLPGYKDDFSVSVNGCFAVSKNRRNLENSMDDDMASGDLLRLKSTWNRYLFEKVIPIAWKNLLSHVKDYVSFEQIYTLWPIPADGSFRELDEKDCLWFNLLQNVINQLDPNLCVFHGPSKYLSINDGYLNDKKFDKSSVLSEILTKLDFPIFVNIPDSIVDKLEQDTSKHKKRLNYITPEKICKYILANLDRLKNLGRQEKLVLLEYVLKVNDVSKLYGLPLLPLENQTFTTFESKSRSKFHIASKDEHILISKDYLGAIVDTTIGKELLSILQTYAINKKNINIQILSDIDFAEFLKKSLQNYKIYSENSQEMQIEKNQIQWIYKIWDHLKLTNRNLQNFSDIHLLPIENNNNVITLKKLRETPKCLCRLSRISTSLLQKLVTPLKLLGSTFVDINFEKQVVSKYEGDYVIEIDNITAVFSSLRENPSFPLNITQPALSNYHKEDLISYIGAYLRRESSFDQKVVDVIKQLPIFNEVNKNDAISINSLDASKRKFYLLPKEDELTCGLIISPCAFLDAHTSDDTCFILENVIKVKRLNQNDYWKDHVISYLGLQSLHIMNQVIVKLFEKWTIIKPFHSQLSNIAFVKTSSDLKKPIEIFDPEKIKIKELFFSDEPFFPVKKYPTNDYLFKLRELGMKKLISSEDAINRIEEYKLRMSHDQIDEVHAKSLLLLNYIDNNYTTFKGNNSFQKKILSEKWIPTFNSDNQLLFSKPSDCRDRLHAVLVSYTMPIVNDRIMNDDLRKVLGWDAIPSTEIVINQLLRSLEIFKRAKKYNIIDYKIRDQVNAIYKHFTDIINQPNESNNLNLLKQELSGKKWILNDDKLYSTNKVVFSLPNFIHSGYWVQLSHQNKRFSLLFEKLGVKKALDKDDYFRILCDADFSDPLQKISVISIIDKLSKIEKDLTGLLIPNMECNMIDYKTVLFDDMGSRVSDTMKDFSILAHTEISKDLANRLMLRNFSETFLEDTMFNFGQHEELTTRLKNILREIVFREFLQNADDAGASRFCVILDESQYSTKHLLKQDTMECWQGPAIWIYNDGQFSDEDFKSLCNVGKSSKWLQYDKIGKFGLGFNSCYHFTDLPQLISGTDVIFFDPQKVILPNNSSGARFSFKNYNADHIFNKFKDQFEPFLKFKGCGFEIDFNREFKGTLFRLPLRQNKSLISDEIDDIEKVKESLNIIKNDAMSELIFLRNVKRFEVYRKSNKKNDMLMPLWKVEITGNAEKRKSYGKELQAFQLDVQLELSIEKRGLAICSGFVEKKKKEQKSWLICTGENNTNLNTWGGISVAIPETPANPLLEKEITQNGNFHAHLLLSIPSGLTVNLHASGWALSSDRRSLVFASDSQTCIKNDAKATQNMKIMDLILPELHVKLFEEYIKIEDYSRSRISDNANFQGITRLWPIPENKNAEILKYGQKVLEIAIEKGCKIFWSTFKDGTYVSFKDCVFVTKETPQAVVHFLNEQDHPAVLMETKRLEELETLQPRKASPELVRKILKNNETFLNMQEDYLFTLFRYILEDKKYDDLEDINLVPLFNHNFGKFQSVKTYYISTKEQYKLFPNAGPCHFIPIELLKSRKLMPIFSDDDFRKATNIQDFGEPTINHLLYQELHIESERDWNPHDLYSIPNQRWLDEIWKYIGDNPLEPYNSFPLLEVYDPKDPTKHQLVSIKNATSRPLITYSDHSSPSEIIQTLANIGLRFTKRNNSLRKKIPIYALSPYSVLLAIQLYQCVAKNRFNNKHDREILCQYLCRNINRVPQESYLYAPMSSLPIWPTHIKGPDGNPICKAILDADAYLIPKPANSLKPFTFYTPKNNNTYYFDTTSEADMRNLFEYVGAKVQDKLRYIKDIIVPNMNTIPQNLQESYIKLLIEIFTDSTGIDAIKDYLKDLKVIPNQSFTLFCARDLFDSRHQLFKFVYKESDRFLHNSLQDNSYSIKILEEIGFRRRVTPDIYIRCAEEIQKRFQKNDDDLFNKREIISAAKRTLFYFYDHQSWELSFSGEEWNELSKIKFVPTSKIKCGPNELLNELYYSYSKSNSDELESFENLCHPKYMNLAWTQLSFFEDEPPEGVLKNHENLGLPTIPTIVNHLKAIQSTISKSDDWKKLGNIGSRLLFEELEQIYKKLENDCEEIRTYFPKGLKRLQIFLNGTDPFNSYDWVTAPQLDLKIDKDFSPRRRAVAEHLLKYPKLLELAGVNSPDIPIWTKPEPKEENNNNRLSKSMIKFLDAGNETSFNNVAFNIQGQEIYANSSILICAAPYFEEIFIESSNFDQTYDDIEPDSFRVLLRWLYGESLSQAMQKYENEENRDISFQICKDLLLASKKFELGTIRELIEYKLVSYINEDLVDDNLGKIKELADECELDDLFTYCESVEEVMKDDNDESDSCPNAGENDNIRITKKVNNNLNTNASPRSSIVNSFKIFRSRFLKTKYDT
ncbi:20676_t:CDS:2 [Gigaspora margarita]|uniref:20676_t:CDS:1 n=1 Tax=Gigaspora margarita TaxID=4874 RepID=A0ABM8VWF4_GIGMA|nr:20676_t:CDS:2 [Gigaspora margarita]